MPASVPAGHTRGTIVVIGNTTTPERQQPLLQRFWNEAGGYGARIVICETPGTAAQSQAYATLLRAMEAEHVEQIQILDRSATHNAAYHTAINQATGILLLAATPIHVAALIGGTQLATTLRRANAHGKTVAGIGDSAAILCQHMMQTEEEDKAPSPLLHRNLIQFSPGLGMVNRLLLAIEPPAQSAHLHHMAALLTAVAYNPFLVGVDIAADTGIVIYADTTVEVFGANNVVIVDGNTISYTDVAETKRHSPISVHGVQVHVLKHGQTFNFDSHHVQPQAASDIPVEGAPNR